MSEHDVYEDGGIESAHAPVPRFLIWTYLLLPFWGAFWFYMYWNGSHGWLDRGYWQQLQRAAETTYPHINLNTPPSNGTGKELNPPLGAI